MIGSKRERVLVRLAAVALGLGLSVPIAGRASCSPPLAFAQAAPAQPGQAAIERARGHMEKGQGLFVEGKYAEAMAEFEKAYETLPYGAFLYNAALAAEKAQDRQRAIAHYREFLASDPHAAYRVTKRLPAVVA